MRLFFIRLLCVTLVLGVIAFFEGALNPSSAQSVIIQQPVDGPLTSAYGPRTSPKAGASSQHKGQDIAVPSGTPVTNGGTILSCAPAGNAGIMATVDRGCCVREIFMHLDSCSGSQIVSDNTGNSTGAHLHWEVHVKGVKVDPAFAIGKNLCDANVANSVIQDAYSKLPASVLGGSGSSSGDCTAPPQQQGPVDEVQYLPPGAINPVTGEITPTTGSGYTITRTSDGRVIVEPNRSFFEQPEPLPPSITDGFLQHTSTNEELTGCSTETWTAMTNQAVLQTRRETMVNQTLITKADSVLSYSCLQKQLVDVGATVGPIFSESALWANKQVNIDTKDVQVSVNLQETSLDGAISNTAQNLAQNFIDSSFYHDYLGGTAGEDAPIERAEENEGHDDVGSMQGGYSCEVMNSVWNTARCKPAFPDNVGFPTFQELVGNDLRIYPQNLKCLDSGIAQSMIDRTKGPITPAQSHMDILAPDDGECAPPIPTGITIQRRVGPDIISNLFGYQDAVCPTPGCSYKNPAFSGLGTCERE